MQKPTDAKIYWETFLTPEGEKCEFAGGPEPRP
jgi:hypothetical protein